MLGATTPVFQGEGSRILKLAALLRALAGGLALMAAPPLMAVDAPQTVHWAFSSYFGTGWYQVDDSRSVFVFRIPPRWTVRRSAWEDGQRKLGIEIHFPATIGLHNLDFADAPGNIAADNFGTFSFTPGIELEIPLNERWALRPYVKAGWGKEFELNETAWIWETGIKSRYAFQTERLDWGLIASLQWAGYDQSAGDRDDTGSILLGVEARQPLRSLRLGRHWDLHWHAAYTFLESPLRFQQTQTDFIVIDDLFEVGLAVSLREGPFDFWFWKPDRLGLGIKFSPDGNFSALTFTSRSWFTK